jgi:sodium/hydrogen antiporter
MSNAHWALLAGTILITTMLIGTLVSRLPLSGAMVYLGLGVLLGPYGIALIHLDPIEDVATLELLTEIALLISLFSAGLKLEVPLRDRRWVAPIRLAFLSMALTVAIVAVVGVQVIGLSVGAAIVLGGILAPTDPVLASAIQSSPGAKHDQLRFSLAGEGALNDGTAFPVVLLGLGMMQLHDIGRSGWRWWWIDLAWSTLGGALIGFVVGAVLGKLVVFLRTRHQSAVGMDEFLCLGIVAIAYGSAHMLLASGFLSVFFAGLALRSTRDFPLAGTEPMGNAGHKGGESPATHSHHASGAMSHAVLGFNEQLERIAELGIVLVIGALLSFDGLALLWWFVPLLFLLARPVSVVLGLAGGDVPPHKQTLIAWLGIRGIGSVYYLVFALRHGVPADVAQVFIPLTLGVVAASILAHGMTVSPLMAWYASRHRTGAGRS